jgi:hypothetical protein
MAEVGLLSAVTRYRTGLWLRAETDAVVMRSTLRYRRLAKREGIMAKIALLSVE